jgi:formylglycine-generating enzyme required for sulfatase activity
VPYIYLISKFETTNTQYAEFLNAVASDDHTGLYSETGVDPWRAIDRTGTRGDFTYHVRPGHEMKPQYRMGYLDALRFANWLHNGQPIGAQDNSTTEDGAYTITAQSVADKSIRRNPDARFFLTSENEWFKAAYYDPELGRYWSYPTGLGGTGCRLPGDAPNTANCARVVGYIQTGPKTYTNSDMSPVTDVGAYTNSASPYGTFDQGGNASEWLGDAFDPPRPDGSIYLRRRGGSYKSASGYALRSFAVEFYASRISTGASSARIARIPELEIDIDPDSDSNKINTSSTRRLVSVAIVGTDEFDPLEVNPHSLEFGPANANPVHRQGGHLGDINDDGYIDLITHFRVGETGIAYGDFDACITGEFFDGTPLLGCDDVTTVDAD